MIVMTALYFMFPGLAFTLAVKAERYAGGLEQYEVNIAGHRIPYLSGGRGEPLVLLHGFGADKDNWTRIAKYLNPYFRIIAPDLPGFGESSRDATARYAVADQVERVRAFVKALKLRSFHLGGNSMGGLIAGAYAARYPSDVETLWLLAPAGVTWAKKSELTERMEKGDNPLFIDTVEDFDGLLDFAFVTPPNIPGPIKGFLAKRAVKNRAFNAKIFHDLKENPLALEPLLKGLPVPTLIVWGDKDRLLHVSGAALLKSMMPKAEAIVMKNMGHLPMVEKPQKTAADFLAFHGKDPGQ
jgi:pimeloyl-ACP methyl ester carboxylesterase